MTGHYCVEDLKRADKLRRNSPLLELPGALVLSYATPPETLPSRARTDLAMAGPETVPSRGLFVVA